MNRGQRGAWSRPAFAGRPSTIVAAGLLLLLGPEARAQAPTAEAPPQVGDLSTKFRFLERYAADPSRARPEDLSQYRVASRDVIKRVVEKPQGAPDRDERTVQIIYTERPAAVNSQGVVTDTVRRYDAIRVAPAPEARPSAPKPLEGLSVWYRSRPGLPPQLMSLDGDRRLTETDYAITLRQVFLPDLSSALPTIPSHVGDRWRLPRPAAQALLGEKPLAGSEPLVGTLLDVRKAEATGVRTAVIGVAGKAMLQGGETFLNAQILFSFAPAAEPGPAGTVEARGAITEVRLARTSTSSVPGSEGRLRHSLTWELTLQREVGNAGAPLPNPSSAPSPTELNSWLTYEDPKGRFSFRHPQDYLPQNLPMLVQDDVVQLADIGAGAGDGRVITLKLQTPTGNAEDDKNARDPDAHVRELNEDWARTRQDVLRGPAGWLPEADWAPFNMQVYRIEAALKPSGPESRNVKRIFLDHYLVWFTQKESLVVDAMTGQDPPLPFRQEVESILKTFALGPAQGPAPAVVPAPGG